MTDGSGPAPGGVPPYRPMFNRTLDKVWDFIEVRAGTNKWALRPQPDFSFNPSYWTGGFVANAFLIQCATGLLLLLYYVPNANPLTTGGPPQAWATTNYIITSVPMGWLLLSSHLYGAYATIFLAFVHFFRGYYTGVYKRPRELSWMVGTLLLAAMLGMGFTGYLLPFTSLSVGATNVGISLTLSVPVIGPLTAPLLLADGTYQGLLSRMFALHVVIIPLGLAALLYAHLSLFEIHGIAPKASSDPKAGRTIPEHDDKKMGKWFPKVFWYMTKYALLYGGLLFLMAAAWPVQLAAYFGSTSAGSASPEPDWYFLWLYKFADFQYVSPLVAITVPTIVLIFILFLPWLDGPPFFTSKTHPRDRPVFLIIGNFLLAFFMLMTVWGGIMPGVQIPATMYATYLGLIAVVNIVLVGGLYWLYRISYHQRIAAREARRGRLVPSTALASPGATPAKPSPTPSVPTPTASEARSNA